MSDLTATNCGCGCEERNVGCGGNSGFGNSSCLWIIILLFCCGGMGNGCGGHDSCGFGGNDSCMWIIILLFCCGGMGNGCGC